MGFKDFGSGIFEKIDSFIEFMGDIFESGFFYYVIIIALFLLILTGIIVAIFWIKGNPFIKVEEIAPEKLEVMNNAPSFCNQKGFNSWKWVNESGYSFSCVNVTQETPTIERFYRNET